MVGGIHAAEENGCKCYSTVCIDLVVPSQVSKNGGTIGNVGLLEIYDKVKSYLAKL